MIPYPFSIVGYFILGVAGACTFMFLLLMFDKDITILRNKLVKLPWMIGIYAILGGVLSVVVNLVSSPNFDSGQFTLAFSAGMGWPALATGISAAKKVGDVKEDADKKIQKTVEDLSNIEDRKLRERDEFYKEKIDNKDATIDAIKELFDKEIERVKAYYSGQESSTEGGE